MLLDTGSYSAKVHWTDAAFRWHENRGDEVFVVLDGVVEPHHFHGTAETVQVLTPGQLDRVSPVEFVPPPRTADARTAPSGAVAVVPGSGPNQ